jgi:glyoxylase-like metal-dependent hydrolase (beta-lactamase superfamily II)
MMEILPGVHRIESIFDRRLVTSYLLVGKRGLLIDSGLAYTPEETILPYLNRLGISVEQITWLVVTHASGDHFGGNHVIKSQSPGTTIVAHELDADCIANYPIYIREQIDWIREYDIPYPPVRADDLEFLALHGVETPVDWRIQGGESLDLGDGWSVVLLHTPGHTAGHLMVYDARHRAVFAGDGIMGDGVPAVDGDLVLPPHYFEVDWYLQTIAKVRALKPQRILATHYEPLVGRDAVKFIDASEAFVRECDLAILRVLEVSGKPLSFLSIVEALRREIGIRVGSIPASNYVYSLLIQAHLRRLVTEGQVIEEESRAPDNQHQSFSIYR